MNTGHWLFPHIFDPDEWFGFIYRITELDTCREYLGKKQFHQHLRKAVKGKVNKKKVTKESDWRTYTGSCERLNLAIKLKGMSNYTFEIVSLHKTRGSLVYAEVRMQIAEEVLRARLPNGERKYYNGLIAGVKFLPPLETLEESQMKK
jgi:hypothetical protein